MIVPDVNLLLYAYDTLSPFHARAVAWWQSCLTGDEPVGLAHVVMFGFMRVSTSPRAFHRPLAASEAAGHVRSWLEEPVVQVLVPGPAHAGHVLNLLGQLGTAGNLVTDAQIAALAIEHDAVVHTSDADFTRFPGLRWQNPITTT
jgi:toxin-antitoxin system PIN domain toxin